MIYKRRWYTKQGIVTVIKISRKKKSQQEHVHDILDASKKNIPTRACIKYIRRKAIGVYGVAYTIGGSIRGVYSSVTVVKRYDTR